MVMQSGDIGTLFLYATFFFTNKNTASIYQAVKMILEKKIR